MVLSMATAILILAAVQLPHASISALPEFTPTYVEIQTEALGLSANEVEQMVTVPLEADLLNGVEDVQVIRSQSVTGLSRVVMVFKQGIDQYVARSRVAERLTQSAFLPQVSKPPTMLPPLSTESRLMMFSMVPDQVTPIEASVLARWTVRPKLMGIPGVANVNVWGMRDRQLQVQVDPVRMRSKHVTLNQVIESAGNAQVVSPLTFLEASTPGTGGFIETSPQRLAVRHILDSFATPAQLGMVPIVDSDGTTLSDVATIVEDHQPLIGDAVVGDKGPGLLLVVEKFPGANAAEVTDRVTQALEDLKPGLTGITVSDQLFRAADYLNDLSSDLLRGGLLAAGLFVLALLLWFRDWRAALVGLVSVLVSVAAAALVIQTLGQPFNPLTLAGLAAAAALAAFDTVSAVSATRQHTATISARRGVGHLGLALLISLAAILPAAVIGGRPGGYLAPLLSAYALGALASFFASVVVASALANVVRPVKSGPLSSSENSLTRLSAKGPAPTAALLIAAVMAAATIGALTFGPKALVQNLHDRNLVIGLEGPPGTSLPAMTTSVTAITTKIRAVPGVASVAGHIGRAIGGDQIADVNSAQVWVTVAPDADLSATADAITTAARSEPSLTASVNSYSSSVVTSVGSVLQGANGSPNGFDILTGTSHPIVVRVFGEDLATLQAKAQEIAQKMGTIGGLTGVVVQPQPLQNSIQIRLDMEKAKASGMKPGDVRRAEATLVQGIQVGSIFQGQKVFDVIVRGAPATRESIDAIKNLVIDSPNGKRIKLSDVADVTEALVPVSIDRDSVARRVDVVADLADGADAAQARSAIRQQLKTVTFPLEHHAEVLGDGNSEVHVGNVAGVAVGSLLAILLLLQAAFGSWRSGAIALLVAGAGSLGSAVVALTVGVNVATLLGALVVLALGCRAALLVYRPAAIDDPVRPTFGHGLNQLVGGSVAAAAILLPLAVVGGAGLELVQPLAWSILAGLVTMVAVSVLLLPVLYRTPRPGGAPSSTPGDHTGDEAAGVAATEATLDPVAATVVQDGARR